MQLYHPGNFQQFIARDIAYCLISATFPGQWTEGYSGSTWWADGLATFLSDTVYADVDLEWDSLPMKLENEELQTTLLQRRFTNWAFFEHASGALGTEGILQRVGSVANLDPDFENQWHVFNEKLSDGIIRDQGGGGPDLDPNTETAEARAPGPASEADPQRATATGPVSFIATNRATTS